MSKRAREPADRREEQPHADMPPACRNGCWIDVTGFTPRDGHSQIIAELNGYSHLTLMKLDTYEREGRILYSAFAQAVASIVASAIAENGGFKLQQVQTRAKQIDSLRQKMATRRLSHDADVEELKDLAGCRAIFYTNTDVDRFLNSGLVEANFEVVERRLHHPHRQADDATDLYMANHYVVRLTDARASLPEYRRFADLKCELQIQTILNHSWAATAHDTIYKAPELKNFGTQALKGIERRLARIARKYLIPAGYEFDRVVP